MSRKSSRGKETAVVVSTTPVSKRTRQANSSFDPQKFKSILDNKLYLDHFKNAQIVVERMVELDSSRSTVIPSIFANKDWSHLLVICSKTPLRNSSKNCLQMHSTMELN